MHRHSELRSGPRTALSHAVQIERSALGGDGGPSRRTQGFGRDISQGGLGVITRDPLQIGEILRVHVPVLGAQASIPVFSQVRWTRPEPDGCCAGLRFLT